MGGKSFVKFSIRRGSCKTEKCVTHLTCEHLCADGKDQRCCCTYKGRDQKHFVHTENFSLKSVLKGRVLR